MIRRFLNWAVRFGARSAANTALGVAVEAVPKASHESYTQVFNVTPPVTVYVRGSQCRVTVRRETTTKVTLHADMYRKFGLDLAAEQDEAGVYIVARQKTVVGRLSRAHFTVTVPADTHLVFRLTPGDIIIQDINGMLELPPAETPARARPSEP